jgi:hypothetical protein
MVFTPTFWESNINDKKPNNAVIHECLLWHEWIIIAVCLQVIYFWYSEYKWSYTVYYIEFTLLFGLIRMDFSEQSYIDGKACEM